MDQGSSSLGSTPPRQGPPDNLPRPDNAPAAKSEGIDLRFPDSTAAQSLPKPPTPPSSSAPSSLPPTAPLSTTKGPATTSVPTEYKTSIRTMAEDMSKIKVGQQPSGVEIQKTIPTTPRPVAPAPVANPVAPVAPTQTSLGQAERSRPLAPSSPMPQPRTAPVRPPAPPAVSLGRPESARPLAPSAPAPRPVVPARPAPAPIVILPESSGSSSPSRGILYLILLGVLLAGGGLFWILKGDKEVAQTPTPIVIASKTPTPSPTPSIGTYITGTTETITLATTGNITADFLNKVNALSINPGEIKKIMVSSETKGSGDFGMIDLLSELDLPYPAALESQLGADSLILVFGQRESFTATGQPNLTAPVQKRLIFLTDAREATGVNQTTQAWEATMADSFASLFTLNKTKAAGTGFLSNTYSGTSIRYRNYPYPDRSIDHALVLAPNGKQYLMVAGSREASFSTLEAVR